MRIEPPRPLWLALAHCFAATKLGEQRRLAVLGRIFNGLLPGDKLRCLVELRECQLAKRGERLAVVS